MVYRYLPLKQRRCGFESHREHIITRSTLIGFEAVRFGAGGMQVRILSSRQNIKHTNIFEKQNTFHIFVYNLKVLLKYLARSYKGYYGWLLTTLSVFESLLGRFSWFIQHGVLWHTEIHRNLFCNWNCDGVGCLIASVAQLVDCAWLVIMILRNTSVRIRALALWLGGAIGRRGRLKSDFSEGSIPSWATKVGYVFCYFYLQAFNLCIIYKYSFQLTI